MGNGTSIGRVRALGSAHSGTHHWLLQRLTALGMLVLMAFVLVSFASLGKHDYPAIVGWLVRPLPALAVALLIIALFWHARLGLQVLIEDYVHEAANKVAAMVLLNLAMFGVAAAGLFFLAGIVFSALGQEAASGAMQSMMQGGH
jgi:succinate dehydrogenase / fumarate reductase membrane anchor subunit